MKKKVKRLIKIRNLQNKLKTLDEWKLNELRQQQKSVDEVEAKLMDVLNKPEFCSERLGDLIGKNLNAVNHKREIIEASKAHRRKLLDRQARRLKKIENAHKIALAGHQEYSHKKELTEIIEIALRKQGSDKVGR